MKKALYYYANARLNGKTAILAGPYATAAMANNVLDAVAPAFLNDAPEAADATFGVMECNRDIGHGRYNHLIN